MASFQASAMGWPAAAGMATPTVVKKVIRLDVPVEKFPNYNFVGRPRGNSLKRIEAMRECRIFFRGRGFVKDTVKVYKLAEDIKAKGGTIARKPGPVKGGSSIVAFAKDPDGYLFELIDRPNTTSLSSNASCW